MYIAEYICGICILIKLSCPFCAMDIILAPTHSLTPDHKQCNNTTKENSETF